MLMSTATPTKSAIGGAATENIKDLLIPNVEFISQSVNTSTCREYDDTQQIAIFNALGVAIKAKLNMSTDLLGYEIATFDCGSFVIISTSLQWSVIMLLFESLAGRPLIARALGREFLFRLHMSLVELVDPSVGYAKCVQSIDSDSLTELRFLLGTMARSAAGALNKVYSADGRMERAIVAMGRVECKSIITARLILHSDDAAALLLYLTPPGKVIYAISGSNQFFAFSIRRSTTSTITTTLTTSMPPTTIQVIQIVDESVRFENEGKDAKANIVYSSTSNINPFILALICLVIILIIVVVVALTVCFLCKRGAFYLRLYWMSYYVIISRLLTLS